MCFSANASFAGGIVITAIGVAVVTKIHKPSQMLFACIPLFFGIQQFTEGILWLTIPNPEQMGIQKIATYVFLVMAQVLWPTWIPLSILFMEENPRKKKAVWVFLAIGMAVSVYYIFCLAFLHVTPKIMSYHIQYTNDFSRTFAYPIFFLYLIATITPLFVSSIKRMHFFGILMFFSCAVTAIFFTQFLTSVWCFFAALISGVIFWILRESKIKFRLDKLNLLKH